jgi:hypothetical protein
MRRCLSRLTPFLAAGLVGACSSAQPTAPAPTSSVDVRIALPLSSFQLSDAEQASVLAARRALMARCMRAAGYGDVDVQLAAPSGTDLVSFANRRRYGLLDQGTAVRWGYHLPRDAQAGDRYAAVDRWKRTLTDRERLALEGRDGAGGCYAAAGRALAKGVQPGDGGLLTRLDFASLKQSRSQPRVVRAARAWKACVAGYGLRYDDPDAAISDRAWRLDSRQPTPAEVHVARVDVTCKARTRLVQTWLGVETQLQRRMIETHAPQFRRIAAAKRAYLANGKRALAR